MLEILPSRLRSLSRIGILLLALGGSACQSGDSIRQKVNGIAKIFPKNLGQITLACVDSLIFFPDEKVGTVILLKRDGKKVGEVAFFPEADNFKILGPIADTNEVGASFQIFSLEDRTLEQSFFTGASDWATVTYDDIAHTVTCVQPVDTNS